MQQDITPKRENWNGRYVYVVRENGKIKSWRNVKGSNTSIKQLQTIYKQNKTLTKTKKRVPIGKRTDIELTIKPNRNVPKRLQQIGVRVLWFDKQSKVLGETTGYSRFITDQSREEAQKEAFVMAQGRAFARFGVQYNDNFKILEVFYQSYITRYQNERKARAEA